MNRPTKAATLSVYPVWDKTTCWFHWINVLCILGLAGIGTVILNDDALGLSSTGKISLKVWHVWIGYIFTFNLLWRIIWGFCGGHYARWSAVLPGGKGYFASLKAYVSGWRAGNPPAYKGHNPLGRLMVALMFVLFSTQMATGLVLAGTDLYYPPFGHQFAIWATGAEDDPSKLVGLKPGDKDRLDPEGYAAMREFRAPFVEVHELSFFVLIFAIVLHIAAVVITEIKERSGLISAMFSGSKVFDRKPED
jgi:Ni/Fe-hydrogenase 1 B-type cytochrome subunit